MKKLFLFLLIFSFALASTAQDKSLRFTNKKTFIDVTFSSSDTISNNDTLYSVEITGDQAYKQTQDLLIQMDSTSGSPEVAVTLQGRKFSENSWTDIGSATTWYGTSADTTFVISNTTANRYRFYRILFDATSAAQKVTIADLKLKVWRE